MHPRPTTPPNRIHSSAMRGLALASALIVAILGTTAAKAQPEEGTTVAPQTDALQWLDDARILDPESLRTRVAEGEAWLDVIVNLTPSSNADGFREWRDRDAAEAIRAEISIAQNDVFARQPTNDFRLEHVYENLASFSCSVTLDGLALLLQEPTVASIETVIPVELHTKQGIPLMNTTATRSRNIFGNGVSIAIVDSGIDYNHPYLGNGGFPNNKVIGGYDFFNNDGDPIDDQSHGTSVAGIAAGNQADDGDYIGGMAPNAKLYALKTVDSSGNGTSAEILAAWDWCVTHQFDDPANPILVINNSLGGGEFTGLCDGMFPSLATAAANCNAAGITIFASSGNDGLCNAVSFPGCLFRAVTVGSVFDDDLPSLAYCVSGNSCAAEPEGVCTSGSACRDDFPLADNVPCYSNSSTEVLLLAPSYNTTTPTLGGGLDPAFGGTSASAPYAAGAAACLQEAALPVLERYLSPQEIRTKLFETGQLIFDLKNGLLTPRINLDAAIDTLPSPIEACQGQDNEIVLSVNGSTSPVVALSRFQAQVWTMQLPSGGGNGKFFVHVNTGAPTRHTLRTLPADLGRTCFPLLLPETSPIGIFNNLGKPNRLGTTNWRGVAIADPPRAPASFYVLPPLQFPVGSFITLQGAILNPNASAGKPASVTNSVTVLTLP